MNFRIKFSSSLPKNVTLRVRLVTESETKLTDRDELAGLDLDLLKQADFKGKKGSGVMTKSDNAGLVYLEGLGEVKKLDTLSVRRAGIRLGREFKEEHSLALEIPKLDGGELINKAEFVEALVDGLILGSYRYEAYFGKGRKNKKLALSQIIILEKETAALKKATSRGLAIANAVCLTRDLVNEPGGDLTPIKFANLAKKVATTGKLKIKVLGLAEIKKAKMGGILGVTRGSTQPPRFVEMEYTPKPTTKPKNTKKAKLGHLILVGKGITFDSGGLSIKSGAGMMMMKCDMGGAGAVLGAMSALRELSPNTKVTALLPLSDNMLGGDATRPGDVLTIRNGKTVEVLNTDAEGRLVLADALSLATEKKPDAIIDLATLTGACVVALGDQISGLMTNSNNWRDEIEQCADRVGERVWRLPLPDDYRSMIESPVADIKNIGGKWAGALTAGLFLKEFVSDEVPWAHLDIAGPSFHSGESTDYPKGGSGVGVRLLLELIENF